MQYPFPFAEERRQRVLDETGILDTPKAPEFDRLTDHAADYFQTPIAIVSLVDRDRQWFKSCVGLDACETGRDVAFCAHTVTQEDVLLVLDATKDPRFKDNALVTGPPHIRFYAGAPIIVDGVNIGSFCIIDDKPRDSFSINHERRLKA
ncbi:MAG: GAF domain-containing protein, partial [Pseudomonadota bacterium]